jgi:hypothetical protein
MAGAYLVKRISYLAGLPGGPCHCEERSDVAISQTLIGFVFRRTCVFRPKTREIGFVLHFCTHILRAGALLAVEPR